MMDSVDATTILTITSEGSRFAEILGTLDH